MWIYFLLLIFFGSVFILNMLLGVMTRLDTLVQSSLHAMVSLCSVFVGVSERRLAQGSSRKLRERQRIEDDLKGYHKWIKLACMSQFACLLMFWCFCVSLVSEDEDGNEIKTRKSRSYYFVTGMHVLLLWTHFKYILLLYFWE